MKSFYSKRFFIDATYLIEASALLIDKQAVQSHDPSRPVRLEAQYQTEPASQLGNMMIFVSEVCMLCS